MHLFMTCTSQTWPKLWLWARGEPEPNLARLAKSQVGKTLRLSCLRGWIIYAHFPGVSLLAGCLLKTKFVGYTKQQFEVIWNFRVLSLFEEIIAFNGWLAFRRIFVSLTVVFSVWKAANSVTNLLVAILL